MQLSVLMSVRNGAQFLPTSIKDIESNVSEKDEIVIVNDGSSDRTGELLSKWALSNKQVRIITTEALGFAKALNLGLEEARNNWIARFDVDDRYPSNRLTVQRDLISNNVVAIFCDYDFWSETNKSLGVIPGAINSSATAVSLVSSQRTPHPGVIFNKTAVIDSGGYREVDFPAEDISLWLRMAKTGNLITAPQVLVNYRLSQDSMSGSNRHLGFEKTEKLIEEFGINSDAINDCLNNWREMFEDYEQEDLSSERKLLLYRDLRRSIYRAKSFVHSKRELSSIARAIAIERESYTALLSLRNDKVLRKKFRSS